MKIKIDENLAAAHKLLLAQAGHDVADVDVRRLPPGGHAGILLVRAAHPSRNFVATVLRRVLGEVVLDTLAGCLVVADEGRTRIRKGKQGA